ncbi:MAG TPA: NADH-quinone oxidoreductase subunit L [Verrucomicrobiae bacterium]|jgi:NADH-quinone oxidoreductase subunit L
MEFIVKFLWLIPTAPLLSAGICALLPRERRRLSAGLAIGAISISFLLACAAFVAAFHVQRAVFNFTWFEFGTTHVPLGWMLDPLGAGMAVMVALVSLLVFIYSTGYMAHDENFTRFFCFLALFAAAMLGLIIANSLLLFFICWELVGLASYLLIGFWFQKPSAAAAAKKAFITTRIGDMGFLIGMLWLYASKGTLLFYDGGHGCLETGLVASTTIGLLIFCGAVGKSGQVPLHVWLPDAMEGPTPVSALIHAATMVAAGVFLIARVYPLMSPEALQVVTWVGAVTAVFAASIAVAQNDIKRILAYSTVSQLGYMMMGLGAGGVAVGMFHLVTHAFFKALLFMGAGSVIHGCHEEQDISNMGGLRKRMPVTFATYAVGMMALCGVPLFFSGFWSKDAILDAAHHWPASRIPFYLGLIGAFLTAFYMTRQVCAVFLGKPSTEAAEHAHESPSAMTMPLLILAVLAVVAGFFGTPAWPWFRSYLAGAHAEFDMVKLAEDGAPLVMLISAALVIVSIALGWWMYGSAAAKPLKESDPLEKAQPALFGLLRHKFYVDEIYEATIVRLTAAFAMFSSWLDRAIWGGLVKAVCWLALLLARINRGVDETLVNGGFDAGTETVRSSGAWVSRWQNGQVQRYLRIIGLGFCGLLILLLWRSR